MEISTALKKQISGNFKCYKLKKIKEFTVEVYSMYKLIYCI